MIKNVFYRLLSSAFQWGLNLCYRAVYDGFREKFDLAKSFRFNGIHIKMYGEGQISIGHNSYVGDFTSIQSDKGCIVSIGENCQISHNVRIYSSTNIANQDFSGEVKAKTMDNVKINDHVWIGANVFINPGVNIGENSIIGSNSVVTRSMPPHSISVGAPAKVIAFKSYLSDKEREMLEIDYQKVISKQPK